MATEKNSRTNSIKNNRTNFSSLERQMATEKNSRTNSIKNNRTNSSSLER